MNEKISIIVPVYNDEEHIEKCVKSLLSQTYENIEVVVVNDGSTDATADKLKEIERNDTRLIVKHIQNSGVTSARLEGIKLSSGDYLSFCDSDDWYDSDACEILLDAILKYDAQMSACSYKRIEEDGNIKYVKGTGNLYEMTYDDVIRTLLIGGHFTGSLWAKMFSRELAQNIDINKDIKYNEDVLMNFLMCEKLEKAVFVDECKYNYLMRSNSSTHSAKELDRTQDMLIVAETLLEKTRKTVNLPYAQIRHTSTLLTRYKSYIIIGGHNRSEMKKIREELLYNLKENIGITKGNKLQINLIKYVPCLYPFFMKIYRRVHTGNIDV